MVLVVRPVYRYSHVEVLDGRIEIPPLVAYETKKLDDVGVFRVDLDDLVGEKLGIPVVALGEFLEHELAGFFLQIVNLHFIKHYSLLRRK